jgi:signal transduction histidine kinase
LSEQELQRRLTELERADRRKLELLGVLAHDVANYVAPARMALHMLQDKQADEAARKRAEALLAGHLEQMYKLIDTLRDIARVTDGLPLNREDTELAPIVARAVSAVRGLVDERRHDLQVAIPPGDMRLFADAARVEQVLTQLLQNAATYSQAGGRIELSAQREGDQIALRVRDRGLGIAPDLLPHIFELFVRSGPRMHGSLGIGLALARKLVELHGGTLTAHSDGPGTGSEFVVRLPAPASRTAG